MMVEVREALEGCDLVLVIMDAKRSEESLDMRDGRAGVAETQQ